MLSNSWHGLVIWGLLCLTTKYSIYCHKQAASLIVRKHTLPSTVVNIGHHKHFFQIWKDIDLLTRFLTVPFFCILPSESSSTTSEQNMISAAENPNYQNFFSWNIDTVAIRKGSFEVIMETRDGKYVCIPCFEMWKEIMAFIKKKKNYTVYQCDHMNSTSRMKTGP